jgi:hypothetical protein
MMETLIALPKPWHEVLVSLKQALAGVGLDVIQSFDLQSARNSLADPELCNCPNHGTSQCSCQYVVVLARREGHEPIAVEVHGHDDLTYLSLAQQDARLRDEEGVHLIKCAVDQLAPSEGFALTAHNRA